MGNKVYIPKYKTKLLKKGTGRRPGHKLSTHPDGVGFGDHDTGAINGTAKGNVSYYSRTLSEKGGAHFFTDDKGTVICVPCFPNVAEKVWGMRYQMLYDNEFLGDDVNDIAINGELCYFDDKERSIKAYKNYVEFMAYLAYIHKANPRRRVGHYEVDPSRRSDPVNALSRIGKTYKDMKDDIVKFHNNNYSDNAINPNKPAAYAKGSQEWVISEGISDGSNPYGNITRNQLWVMLYRIKVTDIKAENEFDDAKDWAISENISDGARPKDDVKRVELWAILARTFGGIAVTKDWKSDANLWVVHNNISDGLSPDNITERQQVWVMLHRIMIKL